MVKTFYQIPCTQHEFTSLCLRSEVKVKLQLSPAIPDIKGPTNFICYSRIFVIANTVEPRYSAFEGTAHIYTL